MRAITDLARLVIDAARAANMKIATAESCTGGMVSASLTDIEGSSAVFDRGFVTYSNDAKVAMLGVDPALIARDGAVSERVARAMAEGALINSNADLAVAITGIAGPGGGSDAKPVGLVHFGIASKGNPTHHSEKRFGALGRANVRDAATLHALDMIRSRILDAKPSD